MEHGHPPTGHHHEPAHAHDGHVSAHHGSGDGDKTHGSPAAKTLRSFATKPLMIGVATGLGVVLVAGLISSSVALYKFGWESPLAGSVVHALPFPAATVNGRTVSYAAYMDDLRTVRHFFDKQREQGAGPDGQPAEAPPEDQLRKGVLDRLIQNQILAAEAAKYGVTVTADETKAEFEKLAGGKADAVEQIKDLYGWTPEEFQMKVIRPYLLEQKLGEAMAKDPAFGGAAEQEAKDVLAKAKAGDDFSELAKTHSDDPGSAQNGGELGFFGKGVMVPEFEAAAFALKVGDVSDLVKTQFGWHIIKVEELKKDKKGEVTEVRAAHVLVSVPTVTDHLKTLFDDAKIKRYVAGLAPETPVDESAPTVEVTE